MGYWLEGDSLAPPRQTGLDVLEAILELSCLNQSSKIIDLGCGDGRICLLASKRIGCKAWGVEVDEHLVDAFKRNISSL